MSKKKLYTFLTFTLFIFLIPSATATTVFVDPQKITNKAVGSTFTVNVKIEDVTELSAFQFYLKYNRNILYPVKGNGDIKIDFLENLDEDGFAVPIVSHEDGYLIVYATYLADKRKSGSGVLATITFEVTGKGYSELDLYDTILLSDKEIQHTVKDGYFENDEGQTIPSTITTVSTTVTTSLPTHVTNYPQWSNLRHEPSIPTLETPVSIFVDWYDDVGIKKVIISENSTGKWVKHIVYGE